MYEDEFANIILRFQMPNEEMELIRALIYKVGWDGEAPVFLVFKNYCMQSAG
jgi:hypothetical protein